MLKQIMCVQIGIYVVLIKRKMIFINYNIAYHKNIFLIHIKKSKTFYPIFVTEKNTFSDSKTKLCSLNTTSCSKSKQPNFFV